MNNNCKLTWYIITTILLVLLLISNICVLNKQKNGVSTSNGADAWDVEIMKVGWQENWDKIEKIYKNQDYIDQQTQAIDETIAEINGSYGEDTTSTSQWNENVSAIVENLLATAPVRGDKNARFTIIEYTELMCPYCQRHSNNGTIESVMEQFPGEVNSVSRHYIIHWQTALELAALVECVGELKPDVYYDVFEKGFEEWTYPASVDTLKNIATNLGVNWSQLQTCIDEWRYLQAVQDMMNQWATVFGISGTPGNVIYDRETGKYQVLPGAYPAENFVEIINNMKNN